jgi:hypothetical protein
LSTTRKSALPFALGIAISVQLLAGVPAALAQGGQTDRFGSRKPECGCYCGGSTPDYVVYRDEDCAGILAADVCGSTLGSLPQEAREGICRAVAARRKIDSCPVFVRYCGPEAGKAPAGPGGGGGSAPSDPDRDGLRDGFGGPPPAPPPGGPSPRRLVYLSPGVPSDDGKPVTSFTVFLDRAACLLPLDDNHRPLVLADAQHVVRGRILRGEGRVRVEAEASELATATTRGPFTGEAKGEDAAAVAAATRAMLVKLELVCRR